MPIPMHVMGGRGSGHHRQARQKTDKDGELLARSGLKRPRRNASDHSDEDVNLLAAVVIYPRYSPDIVREVVGYRLPSGQDEQDTRVKWLLTELKTLGFVTTSNVCGISGNTTVP